jgi:hypothetical protein
MSDLLQVADLERAKLHDTFHSEVITGKAGGLAVGADIEFAINAVTSQSQKTLPKILADIDWSYVGLFADGVTFTKRTDFALDAVGIQWIYVGTYPFTATAGTVPSEPLYQAVHVSDHNLLSNRDAIGAHDQVYQRIISSADLASADFDVGIRVSVSDRESETFEILSSGAIDGLGIIAVGGGKVAIYRPKMTINPKAFGAKYDGVTLDTAANNYASVWSTALLIPVKSPAGTTITGPIVYHHKFQWLGSGNSVSIFKAAAGGTSDIFVSADFDTLTGTNSDEGVYEPVIMDLSIDGNRDRAGNTSGITTGKGLRFYGRTNRFRRLKIYHCAEEGLISEWGIGADLAKGLEGIFEDIECYYNGKDGWIFMGPHDSHCFDIFCHSNSQSSSHVYENLAVKKGNARWSRVHTYSLFYTDQGFPVESARQKTSWKIYREAEGNEISQSHIEGGDVNFNNEANGTKVFGSRIYYPWSNGINIINSGSGVTIEATLGEEYKGIGLPLAKGLVLGGDFGGVSNSTFELSGSGMEAGWVDFGGSAGANSFVIRGFNATVGNTAYLGQPNSTDDVDLYVSGPNLVSLKYETFQTRNAVEYSVSATGSTQATAAQLDISRRHLRVGDASLGDGVKFPNSAFAGNGFSQDVLNDTLVSIKFYPNEGGDLIGKGINNPVIMPPLSLMRATVINADAGKVMWSLFTQ